MTDGERLIKISERNACPYCRALPWMPCKAVGGDDRFMSHSERYQLITASGWDEFYGRSERAPRKP